MSDCAYNWPTKAFLVLLKRSWVTNDDWVTSASEQYQVITHLTTVEETVRVWTIRLARKVPDPSTAEEGQALLAEGGILTDFNRPLEQMKQATEALVKEDTASM